MKAGRWARYIIIVIAVIFSVVLVFVSVLDNAVYVRKFKVFVIPYADYSFTVFGVDLHLKSRHGIDMHIDLFVFKARNSLL